MKNLMLLLLCFCGVYSISAQVLITPIGNGYEDSNVHLSISLGEVAVVTLLSAEEALTQGFQQPEINVVPQPEFDIFIPTGLIPEDSGPNGTFTIEGLEEYPDNELYILNRWGEILYHARPYINNWNGYYNGRPLPQATYFYILRPLPNGTSLKGNLYILKK